MADIDYDRSARRLFGLTIFIGCAGFVTSYALWGGRAGYGFGLGSLASLVNLWLWSVIADSLARKKDKRSSFAAVLFGGRLLALFAFGYVIVSYLDVSPLAALVGLFTSAIAVLAEIVFELAASKRLSL